MGCRCNVRGRLVDVLSADKIIWICIKCDNYYCYVIFEHDNSQLTLLLYYLENVVT